MSQEDIMIKPKYNSSPKSATRIIKSSLIKSFTLTKTYNSI